MLGDGCAALSADAILISSYFLIKVITRKAPLDLLKSNWIRLERLERRVLRSVLEVGNIPKNETSIFKTRYEETSNKQSITETSFLYEECSLTRSTADYGYLTEV